MKKVIITILAILGLIPTAFIAWALGLTIYGVATSNRVPLPSEAQATETQSVKLPPLKQQLYWDYIHKPDKMSKGTIHRAMLVSLNSITFEFPYGEEYMGLFLRTHPRWGKDVFIKISHGQMPCGYSGCTVSVRFDDNPAIKYKAVEPESNDSTTLFITNYHNFVGKMLKAKKVTIEALFFQEGKGTFEFDVSNFNTNTYLGKTG